MHVSEEDLVLLVQDWLPAGARDATLRHLKECSTCAGQADKLRGWTANSEARRNWPRFAVAAAVLLAILVPAVIWQLRGRSPAATSSSLAGLETLPPDDQTRVRAALNAGVASLPAFVNEIAPARETLMGSGTRVDTFNLVSPVGTGIVSDRPRFEWQMVVPSDGYVVTIFDEQSNAVPGVRRLQRQDGRRPIRSCATGRMCGRLPPIAALKRSPRRCHRPRPRDSMSSTRARQRCSSNLKPSTRSRTCCSACCLCKAASSARLPRICARSSRPIRMPHWPADRSQVSPSSTQQTLGVRAPDFADPDTICAWHAISVAGTSSTSPAPRRSSRPESRANRQRSRRRWSSPARRPQVWTAGSIGRCGGCSSRWSKTIPAASIPQFWLDYFRRLHADAATLSAGGIVAYYPTEVPLHHRSAWLGDTRSVRHARRGLPRARHERGRAHRSARGARRRAGRASRTGSPSTRDGQPRRHWANPELWVTCALGPYNFEFMDRVHREIVAKYTVDGVFANRWAPQGGDCYCVHCQQNFRRRPAASSAAHDRPPRSRRGARSSSGASRG